MITTSQDVRDRVEQCRRIAQHIQDPAVRLAMLNQMRLLDQELAAQPEPAEALAPIPA